MAKPWITGLGPEDREDQPAECVNLSERKLDLLKLPLVEMK
jgi:hypothetical protein